MLFPQTKTTRRRACSDVTADRHGSDRTAPAEPQADAIAELSTTPCTAATRATIIPQPNSSTTSRCRSSTSFESGSHSTHPHFTRQEPTNTYPTSTASNTANMVLEATMIVYASSVCCLEVTARFSRI